MALDAKFRSRALHNVFFQYVIWKGGSRHNPAEALGQPLFVIGPKHQSAFAILHDFPQAAG